MERMKKLFVYGTLRKNFGNWRTYLDRADVTFLGNEIIKGNFSMVSLGGFPGVVPHREGITDIIGEVFEVPEEVYRRIEHLEGYHENPKYRFYDKMTVKTAFGDAEMYILDESYLPYGKIESGNWLDR